MIDLDGLKEIWQTIARNKTRSLLTAFGVFWGIFILVVLSSVGNGFENGLMRQIEGFSLNTGFIFTEQTTEPYKGYQKGRYWSMDMNDLEAIKDAFPEIVAISPEASLYSSDENNVVFGSKSGSYTVKGLMPEYNQIDRCKIVMGRFVNETDIAEKRKVCLIGERVYEEMMGKNIEPLGKMIKVNGIYFEIVGVIRPYNSHTQVNGEASKSVILPFTTMQQVFGLGDKINFFLYTARDDASVSSMEEDIKTLLKLRHDIAPNDKEAVSAYNVEEEFNIFKALFKGIHILIWIVGLGTLMSGIIGVSNIMLVTVKERTREIGVRRALGAKPKAILTQVMSESLLLTILAGLVGLCFGVLVMAVVGLIVTSNPSETTMFQDPNMNLGEAIAAIIIVIVSGLLAGLLPALRAIQIKAIDAIREE